MSGFSYKTYSILRQRTNRLKNHSLTWLCNTRHKFCMDDRYCHRYCHIYHLNAQNILPEILLNRTQ